ncbi:MAG: gas vesicle protein [Chloroflexaceae bacterium]|nr:gas vesicle protein [Chloroflexaceae bacterium]NJO06472.1 gas vesicle protein [Chloroflexaceae bacterium]
MDNQPKTIAASLAAPREREIVLLDLLDRALDKGVVIAGDIVISVADVDLIYVGLKVLLTSVDRMQHLGEQR